MVDANTALNQATQASGNVGTILSQEKEELAPHYAAAGQSMKEAQALPQPKLKDAPEPPKSDMKNDAMDWVATLNIVAGLAGAFSRDHGTAAMDAFSAGIKGFKEGKLQQFQQKQTEWKDANEQLVENNKNQVSAYTTALQNKKLSVDEQMTEIQRISAQYHNDIMAQLSAARDFTGVARVVDMMQKHTDDLEAKFTALQAGMDKKNEEITGVKAASEVYKNTYFPGGIPNGKPPPFQAWYKNEWPNLKGGIEGATPATPGATPPGAAATPGGAPVAKPAKGAAGKTKYTVGQVIDGPNGQKLKVVGGDLQEDPDVEPVQ